MRLQRLESSRIGKTGTRFQAHPQLGDGGCPGPPADRLQDQRHFPSTVISPRTRSPAGALSGSVFSANTLTALSSAVLACQARRVRALRPRVESKCVRHDQPNEESTLSPASGERIVVLGGTGFVGRRLLPSLRGSGRSIRVAARTPVTMPYADVDFVACDLASGEGVDRALEGADLAYFLVHGMAEGPGFAAREKRASENFAAAASRQRVGRVVYLGGLYPDGELSAHLESRRQVGLTLIHETGALALRAGVVVGAGGASFEILRALSQRLPVMIAPRWLASLCQPVSIDDTVRGLAGAAGIEGGRELDLVGSDVLTYREMLEITAMEVRGRKPLMFPVPLLSPELSAHWLRFVARVDMNVARSLVASLRHDLVAERPLLMEELGLTPVGFRESVRTALAELGRNRRS